MQPRIAQAYQATNDLNGAAAALRSAADAAGDKVAKAQLLEKLAGVYVDGGRYAEAVAAYDEILALAANPGYRAEVQYLAGQALSAAGDSQGRSRAGARPPRSRRPAMRPTWPSSSWSTATSISISSSAAPSIWRRAPTHRPSTPSRLSWTRLARPTHARGNALHGLGQAYLGAENYAEALTTFDRVIAEYPQCDCFGQAWLDKASAQAGLGDAAGARRTYRTFARDFKDHPLAPEALWQSAAHALDDGNQLEAAADFLTLADGFPSSERAPQALYALGVGGYEKKLFSQAAQVLSRLQSRLS